LCPSCRKLLGSLPYCRKCRNMVRLKHGSRHFFRRLHAELSE
jgi:hypothetical protein